MSLFSMLVSDLRKMAANAKYTVDNCFVVDEKEIRICCVDFQPSELLFSSIRHLFHSAENKADCETYYCFLKDTDALLAFLPEQLARTKGRYVYNGDDGRFAVSAEFGFFSLYSAVNNETYIWLCKDKDLLEVYITHPFRMELGWWAQRNGYVFLHSAAVGTEGKGVLISGAGGSGKSTLSMSVLLSGMDFLSDDYLLVKKEERPLAIRIYGTGYLKQDMLAKLPEYRRGVLWSSGERDKSLISLNIFGKRIVDTLPLHAIIIPHIAHAELPVISRNPDVRKLIPLLSSTSYQNRELKNRTVFFGMMQLLRNLPAFDFKLTDDIRRNAEYLKEWVEKL